MKNIKRINITIDEELLNKIDSYSKKRYLSRSGLISMVLSTFLDSVEKNSFTTFNRLSTSVSDVK